MAAQLLGANVNFEQISCSMQAQGSYPRYYLTNFLLCVQFSSASAGSKHEYQHSGKIAEDSCVSKTASPLPFQARRPLHGGAIRSTRGRWMDNIHHVPEGTAYDTRHFRNAARNGLVMIKFV